MTKSSTLIPHSIVSAEVRERIRSQPECQLLWAVLEETLGTYMKYASATGRRGQRLFKEAEQWIFQDDYRWLCSFRNICHILELEPEYIRTGLTRWREAQQAVVASEAA
jgi:hypothetical protein